MRLRHVEIFHAVLTTGSLTGAARMLNISQPAASKVLQHAEQQLGFAAAINTVGCRPRPVTASTVTLLSVPSFWIAAIPCGIES